MNPPDPEAKVPAKQARGPIAKLSPQSSQAAVLDAWGWSAQRIALEVGVRWETVSGWRRSPVYIEARQAELAVVLADRTTRLQRDKQASFEGVEGARDMLVRDLTAADPNGNPLYGIRQNAAKLLYEDKARTSEYAEQAASGAKVEAKVAVGAVFHVYPGGKIIEASADVVDAEVEEVE